MYLQMEALALRKVQSVRNSNDQRPPNEHIAGQKEPCKELETFLGCRQ
jgi:hypothetical protein